VNGTAASPQQCSSTRPFLFSLAEVQLGSISRGKRSAAQRWGISNSRSDFLKKALRGTHPAHTEGATSLLVAAEEPSRLQGSRQSCGQRMVLTHPSTAGLRFPANTDLPAAVSSNRKKKKQQGKILKGELSKRAQPEHSSAHCTDSSRTQAGCRWFVFFPGNPNPQDAQEVIMTSFPYPNNDSHSEAGSILHPGSETCSTPITLLHRTQQC